MWIYDSSTERENCQVSDIDYEVLYNLNMVDFVAKHENITHSSSQEARALKSKTFLDKLFEIKLSYFSALKVLNVRPLQTRNILKIEYDKICMSCWSYILKIITFKPANTDF